MQEFEFYYRQQKTSIYLHDPGEFVSDWIRRTGNFFEVGFLDKLKQNRNILSPETSSAIDIGANIGNHALFFEKYIGFKDVYALEPITANFALLLKNTFTSHCIKAACSKEHQELTMQANKEQMGGCSVTHSQFLSERDRTSGKVYLERVQAIRLDDLRIRNASLIKIDVEGHEKDVISGGMETIMSSKPLLWLEAHDSKSIDYFSDLLHYEVILSDNYINYIMTPKTSMMIF